MMSLQTNELLISRVLEESADGIFLINNDCKVIYWNKMMVELTGIPADEVSGKSVFNITPQFKKPHFIESIKEELNHDRNIQNQELYFEIEGNVHSYQAGVSRFSFSPGIGVGCMVILRKLKATASQLQFKKIIENSPIATAIYDTLGKPKFINKAYGQIWETKLQSTLRVMDTYNILEDEQLVELGVMPFIKKAFNGTSCEIPPISYNPRHTSSLQILGIDKNKFIKGHLFPIKNNGGEVQEVVLALYDVTFQQQAEKILTEDYIKFQKLAVGLPGVIYEYEEIGQNPHTFRYISEGCMEMFGVSQEEVLKNSNKLEQTIHKQDLPEYRQSMINSEFGAQNWEWRGRIVVGNKVKWIEGKSSPVKLNDGTIVRYGMLLDITDKKQVEQQYKLTEERLQLAVDGADIGLWEWTAKSGMKILNSSWLQKVGMPLDFKNIAYFNWNSFIHPDDLPVWQQKMNLIETGQFKNEEFEYRFKASEEEWIWVHDRGKVNEVDSEGNILHVVGTFLDISDSKISQSLIKHNERLFTQLFENAPMGVVLLNKEHEVVQMNGGFERMFGYKKSEVLGKQLNHLIVPYNSLQEAIDINKLTSKGTVGILESHRLHKNGSQVPVIIYSVPVSLNEETIGIYGIYVDITDRVAAEKELKIRNDELDNFVYKVSHDLRAPLSSVLGLVHLASQEKNEDDIRDYISLIANRVQQLDSFINDVLSHSKNLNIDIKLDSIELNQIIDECFNELSYLSNSTSIIKNCKISSHPFYSDIWRVKEIFRNIISNALKYADSTKATSFVKIDVEINDEAANIRIEDNGIGIREECVDNIFDMFYRATNVAEGSGIGLYIVKNATEKLGGRITMNSEFGQGTIYHIILPNHSMKN